jgi:DNA-binding Lrp family transcriptional regulator
MRELWGSPERWNSRRTYADVAAKLGVDEETVRNRLKRLKESGFLVGWRVVPNPSLLGRETAMMFLDFKDNEAKENALRNLRGMEGVIAIASIYGNSLLVTYYDDAEHRVSKIMAGIRNVMASQSVGGMRLPPTDFRMTPTDWQIVGFVLRNAEEDVSSVARKAKVSSRTVKRRLNSMMDSSAISVMPVINQGRSGGVSYTLMVEAEEGRASEIGEAVTSRIANLVFRASFSRNGMIFGYSAPNVAEGTALLRWVQQLKGVKSARIHLVDEVVYAFDWLEREIRNRAAIRRFKPGNRGT